MLIVSIYSYIFNQARWPLSGVHLVSSNCFCQPLRLLIAINMIWTTYDWLNQSTAVVGITSRHALSIEAHHENQPNQSKLALYNKMSIHFNSSL